MNHHDMCDQTFRELYGPSHCKRINSFTIRIYKMSFMYVCMYRWRKIKEPLAIPYSIYKEELQLANKPNAVSTQTIILLQYFKQKMFLSL